MADITVTAAKVAPVFPEKSDIRTYIATETITAGQAVYILTTGKVGVADANAAGKQQFRGIALNGGAAGAAIDVLHEGEVYGFTLAGNADTLLYLSDTAGVLSDTAGTMTVVCGRVVCLADKSLTKVARVFVQWEAQWA
ncbi:MAG TPA: hypothetical protein PKD55_09695 [Bellilinea sp.]|nr:hypothetical protein [Bellilinea sp.]